MAEIRWIPVARVEEFADTDRRVVFIDGGPAVGLYKTGGEFFALGAWCSHDRALLTEGAFDGVVVTCPLHGARFDVRTGRNLSLPAVEPVESYPVRVVDGRIEVGLTDLEED